MLFKLLKMLGLDVPAKIRAVKAEVQLRVKMTLGRVQHVAQETAIISVLFLLAAITGVVAIGLALGMLYHWIADYYGVYAGLGAVCALMVLATILFVGIGLGKARALSSGTNRAPRSIEAADVRSGLRVADKNFTAQELKVVPVAAMPVVASSPSVSDLLEPLGYFLSKYVQYPKLGEPVLEELLSTFRGAAETSAHDAVDRAAKVVRYGNRSELAVVLGGAAFVGWLLSKQARHSIT